MILLLMVGGNVNKLILGDCLDILSRATPNSVDAIITDPPYGLVSIIKRFGNPKAHNTPAMETESGGVFARKAKGFMGKEWDGSGIENNVDMWAECLRVLKPGGYLLSFGGTRTYHRMASAIEDAGFEIRDMIEWVYGSGFPKSLNIAKKLEGVTGKQSSGFNTAGGKENFEKQDKSFRSDYGYVWKPTKENAKKWEGWGTALKPAHEPICMARKPLGEETVAENVLKYGTGGINIEESRVEYQNEQDKKEGQSARPSKTSNANEYSLNHGGLEGFDRSDRSDITGRFPANLIHDGSDEVKECFPETGGGKYKAPNARPRHGHKLVESSGMSNAPDQYGDSGSASRFFKSIIYTAKASKSERGADNRHPTVKPIALMEYLIKMVTPKGGTVLDPFVGSGSTGVAALKNNYNFIGIELSPEYLEIAKARIDGWRER